MHALFPDVNSLVFFSFFPFLSFFPPKVKVSQSCLTLCDPRGLYSPWNSPGQNTGVGSLSLLQGIFPTQGLNPGLPHWRGIPYQLSYQGSHSFLPLSYLKKKKKALVFFPYLLKKFSFYFWFIFILLCVLMIA